MGRGTYIGGSVLNTIGLLVAIIGIILLIGNFVYHEIYVFIGSIILIICGIILSALGRSYTQRE